METNKILNEIDKLELSEKIILVEDIWDSIAQTNLQLPLPEWQKVELKKRYTEFQKGTQKLHEWGSVHEDLRKKYQ